jgi:hypothetical protein
MACDKYARITVKRSTVAGVVATVPATPNHTTGGWLSTDIYIGEFLLNTADGILYSRDDSGIFIVAQANGEANRLIQTLTTDGSMSLAYKTTKADTTSNNISVTLPPAANTSGRNFTVVKTDAANTVTVQVSGGDTINGAATFVFAALWGSYTFQSDGTEYYLL